MVLLLLLLLLLVRDSVECVHQLVHLLVHARQLLFDAIKSRSNGHRLDVADPVDASQVTARLAERLIQAALQLLDAHHHVEVALRILFNYITNVVRLAGLLELPARHEVLYLPNRPDGVPMCLGQSERKVIVAHFLQVGERTSTYDVTRAGSASSSPSGSTSSLGASVTELVWLTNWLRLGSRRPRFGVPAKQANDQQLCKHGKTFCKNGISGPFYFPLNSYFRLAAFLPFEFRMTTRSGGIRI